MRYAGSSTIEWPGMVSVYAVLGPHPRVTTTGAHQVGIDFGGHRGLVREIDGRAGRHDADPGSVYVTGPSPITWLEVREPTEALEIYPDRALAERLAGGIRGTAEVRPSLAVRDGIVFAVASRLRRAHLTTGTLTDIEASTLAHLLVRHLLRRYGTGPEPRRRAGRGDAPGSRQRRRRVHPGAPGRRDHPGRAGRGGQPEPVPLRPVVPRDDGHDAARLRHRAPADGGAGPAAERRRQRARGRPLGRVLEHQPLPQALPAALRSYSRPAWRRALGLGGEPDGDLTGGSTAETPCSAGTRARRGASGSGTSTGSAAGAGRASRPSPAAWRPGTACACTRPTR